MSTSTARPRTGRERALAALGAIVSLAALAALVVWALHQEAPTFPDEPARLAELAAAIGLYLVACAARSERWYELLRHNGAQPRRVDAYALLAVANAANNVLPARAGDALRVVLVTPRAQSDARTVIATIVAERVRAVAYLAPMAAATRRLRGNHGRELLAWTLLVWALEWLAWWLTAHAAGLGLGVLDVGYLLGLASIFVLVPSGPGFVGTFDAAIVFGVRALGRSGAQALSFLLLLRFVVTAPITLVGLVARYGGVERIRGLVGA